MFICDISVFNRYGKQKLDQLLQPFNLDWQTLVAILVIDQVPGISQNRLVPFLQTDKANVTKLLQALEKDGCIERHTDRADQRTKVCYLTEKGRQMAPQLNEVMNAWEKLVFQDVDENDLMAFNRVAKVITRNLVPDWNTQKENA